METLTILYVIINIYTYTYILWMQAKCIINLILFSLSRFTSNLNLYAVYFDMYIAHEPKRNVVHLWYYGPAVRAAAQCSASVKAP